MCKFCKFTRTYYPTSHHELPPGTTVDASITTRQVLLPDEDSCLFVFESLVASLLASVHTFLKQYDFQRVYSCLSLAKVCMPFNNRVHSMFSLYYLQMDDNENALKSIKTSLKLNNTSGESFLIASHVYLAQEKYDMALKALEIGIVCVPDTPENNDIRKSLQIEISTIKSIALSQEPTTIPTPSIPNPFTSTPLSLSIVANIFSSLDYPTSKVMAIVSKEWSKIINSEEVQTTILKSHTQCLIDVLKWKQTVSMEQLGDAFSSWAKLEKDQEIRHKYNEYKRAMARASTSKQEEIEDEMDEDEDYNSDSDNEEEMDNENNNNINNNNFKKKKHKPSNVDLYPPAPFHTPRFEVLKETVLFYLPIEFLIFYSIHNGMRFYLNGAMKTEESYEVELYPLDSPRVNILAHNNINVPHQFKNKVRPDFRGVEIGNITFSAQIYNPVAYDVWNPSSYKGINPKISLFFDFHPAYKGTSGQICIVVDDELVDVLPGGIKQLLDYLTTLSTCNLVATLGIYSMNSADNHLPEKLADKYALFTPKKKNKKLSSLFREMKRYKSAYKGYQCNMRN